jgi:hypothetical protein
MVGNGSDASLHGLAKARRDSEHLNQLADSGNVQAHFLQNCLRARFQKTEDIGQLVLSFLLTPSGLEWYHSLPEVLPEDNPRTSKTAVRTSVSELRKFCRLKHGPDREVWEIAWKSYLNAESIE